MSDAIPKTTGAVEIKPAVHSSSVEGASQQPAREHTPQETSAGPLLPYRLGNQPQLDGLRAIAIALVMGYHVFDDYYEVHYPGQRAPLQGGFIGVDIFFVLSGFLITTLLLREMETHGRVDLKRFYLKRVRRLYPALLLLLSVFLLVSPLLGLSLRRAGLHAIEVVCYISNWLRAFGWSNPTFLGHTWSLSAEAQFYLVWPCVLIAIFNRRGRKALFAAALGFAAGSWIWRVTLWQRGMPMGRIYNGLDTRSDGLLVGCALGILVSSSWWRQKSKPFEAGSNAIGWGCLLALALFAFTTSPFAGSMVYWGFSLSVLLASALILALVSAPGSFLGRALAHPSLVWIGTLSYGLYLWHYPVLKVLVRVAHIPSLSGVCVLGGVLSLTCANLSYYCVEKRFLRPRA